MLRADGDKRPRGPDTQRRRLISAAAGMAVALVGCGRKGAGVEARDQAMSAEAASPAANAAVEAPGRSRVVIVRSEQALHEDGAVNPAVVGAMLEAAMLAVSGAASLAEAWRTYVRPRDVVAIKVNCLGGPALCTRPALVEQMADGIQRSGVSPENIIIYDRETVELEQCGFTVRTRGGPRCYGTDAVGYHPEWTVIRETGSRFSRIVTDECTAIVNAPILKDHDGAGLSCALKNHFGSINNPNKLHTDHCEPHVADINCAPEIRGKQRISICDALLVCYEGGPGFKPDTTVPYGAILAGTDPVALDTVGLDIIEKLRAENGLEPIRGLERAPTYLATAADAERRLGTNQMDAIEVVERSVTV